jgi:branched-chain amino acid transport system ATP-binding protein
LFNCLSRLYRPAQGDIRLSGQSLRRCAPSDIAALGIGRTFQASTLFASMSVLDNVKVGAHARGRHGPLTDAFTLPSARGEEREFDEIARAMLAFVGLAGKPVLLLLDEPAGGLNHEEVLNLGALIRIIRDRLEITVLLVEHHMNLVMSLSDQVVVLNFGRVIADGPPDEVRNNPAVTEAYLGPRH